MLNPFVSQRAAHDQAFCFLNIRDSLVAFSLCLNYSKRFLHIKRTDRRTFSVLSDIHGHKSLKHYHGLAALN